MLVFTSRTNITNSYKIWPFKNGFLTCVALKHKNCELFVPKMVLKTLAEFGRKAICLFTCVFFFRYRDFCSAKACSTRRKCLFGNDGKRPSGLGDCPRHPRIVALHS